MAICGIGVDICEIERFKKLIEKYDDRFLDKIFTEKEKEYCSEKINKGAPSYSVRFDAKEALFKAIGTGLRDGLTWKDIEVENDDLGKPFFNLFGKTKRIIGDRKVIVSLSHSIDSSIAFVIIEGEPIQLW